MALYSEKVMDHFQHPRNVGVIEDANGVGEVGNAKCGDIMKIMALTNKAVAEALDGLPAHKLHCSVLAEEAIKKALQDYFDRKGIPYDEKDFPACEHCAHCESV